MPQVFQGIIPESHFQGACDGGAWSKKDKGKGFAFSKNISNHSLMVTIFYLILLVAMLGL